MQLLVKLIGLIISKNQTQQLHQIKLSIVQLEAKINIKTKGGRQSGFKSLIIEKDFEPENRTIRGT